MVRRTFLEPSIHGAIIGALIGMSKVVWLPSKCKDLMTTRLSSRSRTAGGTHAISTLPLSSLLLYRRKIKPISMPPSTPPLSKAYNPNTNTNKTKPDLRTLRLTSVKASQSQLRTWTPTMAITTPLLQCSFSLPPQKIFSAS